MSGINMLAPSALANQQYLCRSGNSYTSDAYGVVKGVVGLDIIDLDGMNCIPLGSSTLNGTVTVNGTATVTVTATSIAATDLVSFSLNTLGGTQGAPHVTGVTAGTNFTMASSAGDTSTYNYKVSPSGA